MENKSKKINKRAARFIFIAAICIVLAGVGVWFGFLRGLVSTSTLNPNIAFLEEATVPDWVDVQLVKINGVGRRGVSLEEINSIVIHYVGNPGTTAQQNRNFFDKPDTEVSSHFVIGIDGEVIQCVPIYEKSSASNDRNRDTISIEVCHADETGKFTDASYNSLVKLTAWLCELCGFDETNIIRHYDVTGKLCPLYFVEHDDAWLQFKRDVTSAMH